MRTFKDFLAEDEFKLEFLLKQHHLYLAHLRDDKKELLSAHTNLTLAYFIRIIEENDLERLIDRQIQLLVESNFEDKSPRVVEYAKKLFIKTLLYHDVGKINYLFQRDKMQNRNRDIPKIEAGISSEHSILSAYLFMADGFSEIKKENFGELDSSFLFLLVFLFSYSILRHHGQILSPFERNCNEDLYRSLADYARLLNKEFATVSIGYFEDTGWYQEILEVRDFKESFALFCLLKLNSSLLTASDYYSTNEFMIGVGCNDFGILREKLSEKIIENVRNISYNKKLLADYENYRRFNFDSFAEKSNYNLNELRQMLAFEVIENFKANDDKRLFYIEAPTGSGKTNLSLLLLSELLEKRSDITKVFYVFPFTTLITQTLKIFREDLGLDEHEAAEIHSKADYYQDEDESYGSKRKNFIDSLFVNYPVCLISHIKFFDILTSNKKEINYLLCRIANSVVIIDELQSYNPTQWDKINYLIQKYSDSFNITFVLMSATLPKISKLLGAKGEESSDDFIYLVDNRESYFSNPNFRNRVSFNYDLLERGEEFSFEWLASAVYNKSSEYYKRDKSVKAIVEFVTKKSAQKFFETINNDEPFRDFIRLIISGTILEPRRKEIIGFLKSKNAGSQKIIVVTTQVIEAGLDIDMDLGFKDKSIIDAEEQFAGRINRNARRDKSELFIFNSEDSEKTYRGDLRYKQKLDIDSYKQILFSKDFDLLYEKVFEQINRDNVNDFLAGNLKEFKELIKSLSFKEVKRRFELIKNNSISIFVPLEIKKSHFSDNELRFLALHDKLNDSRFIDGKDIWCLYEDIILNRERDFIERKIDLKILSPIIMKFCFSMWNNPHQVRLLEEHGEMKYGIICLSNYEHIYDYETGLKADIETDRNFFW